MQPQVPERARRDAAPARARRLRQREVADGQPQARQDYAVGPVVVREVDAVAERAGLPLRVQLRHNAVIFEVAEFQRFR